MYKRALGALLTVIGLALSLLAVNAGPASAYTTDELQWASDIASGQYTQWELSQCTNDWGCADIAPDPSYQDSFGGSLTEEETNNQLAAQGMATYTSKASHCPSGSSEHYASHYWNHKSLLGSTIYRWHWAVWYCRDDFRSRITAWTHKADWVTNTQWMVVFDKDGQTTVMGSVPDDNPTAFRQRHIQLCYGGSFACVNRYPWGRAYVHGDGRTTTFTGDDG